MSDLSSQYHFLPRRGLRGAHAQTLAGNFLPRRNLLPPGERRIFKVAEHETGEAVRVECICHWQSNASGDRAIGSGQSGDRVIGSSGEVKASGDPEFKSPDHPITRSPDLQITRSPDLQISRSPDSMTVIIVHGLEGSVESQYVIGTGSKAWAA